MAVMLRVAVLFLCLTALPVPAAPAVASTSPPAEAAVETPKVAAPAAPVVERLTGPVQPFVHGHGELRRRVERERGFRDIDASLKQAFFERQDATLALLAGVERFDAMGAAEYAAFHTSLLELLAAQKAVVGQQLVCRRIRPTGSQIRENVCLTRDEIAARNDDTGDELRKHMQLQQVDYCVAGVCIE
ncbi:MAG: hypothetical protein ACRC2H_05365 [Silanimonas sp.]